MACADSSPLEMSDAGVCSICLQAISDPRLMPCLHSFCRACIDQVHLAVSAEDTRAGESADSVVGVKCPVCRDRCDLGDDGASGLLRDPTRMSRRGGAADRSSHRCKACTEAGHTVGGGRAEREEEVAVLWCEACAAVFCSEHVVSHVLATGHAVGRLPDSNRSGDALSDSEDDRSSVGVLSHGVCERHAQSLRFFCGQCEATICGDCIVVGSHVGHQPVVLVKDMIEREKNVLSSRVDRLKDSVLPQYQKGLESVEEVSSQLMSQAEEVRAEITAAGERAVSAIYTDVQRKLQEVEDIELSRNKVLDKQHDQLKSLAESVKHAVAFWERLSQSTSDSTAVAHLLLALRNRLASLDEVQIDTKPAEHPWISLQQFSEGRLAEETSQCLGRVVPGKAVPSHCYVQGKSTQYASIGTEVTFDLQTADSQGTLLKTGGDSVSVEVHSPDNDQAGDAAQNDAKATVADKNNGLYSISYAPHLYGDHSLDIVVNGGKVPQLLHVMCGVYFDPDTTTAVDAVSEDRQTFQRSPNVSQSAVLGSTGMIHGQHFWRVRIDREGERLKKLTHVVGVTTKEIYSKSQRFVAAWVWGNTGNRGETGKYTSAFQPWQHQDILRLVLDCNAHTLTVTNERSKETDTICDLPDEELLPYFYLCRDATEEMKFLLFPVSL